MAQIRMFFPMLAVLTISTHALAQETISLEKACELARENSPQIHAQDFAIDAAQAQVSEAKYFWAPKFSLTSQFGPMPKETDIHASQTDIWDNITGEWGFTTRNYLEFWFPIFTSTKVYHTHELAKIGLKVEELRAENEILNVEYDVSRAYIGLQLANAYADVIQEAEGYIARVETEYQKMLDNGSDKVKKTDQYRIDIARANLLRLKNEVAAKRDYAERALSVHTRLSLPISIETMDFDHEVPSLKTYDDVLALGHTHRGDLKLLKAAEDAALLDAKIKWLNWWPDLVVAGEVYYKYSNAVPEMDVQHFYIKDTYNDYGFVMGFMLKWDLDPVRQVFQVRRADAKAERMKAQRELAISGIDLQISEDYQSALSKFANIEITHKSRRSAKRFLTQELLDYEGGAGDIDDMISALTTFIEQRAMYLQVLHDYRVALVKLQKTTGATSTADLVLGDI